MEKGFLIIGKQGVGKTRLAELIAKSWDLPIHDGIGKLSDINEIGVYVSNSIPIEVANIGLPVGFTLIFVGG